MNRFEEPLRSRPAPRRQPVLSVVIVNEDRWPETLRLVAALAEAPEVVSGVCEVIVVDNASEGPIPPVLIHPRPGIRLIVRRTNDGHAAGTNAGWRAAVSPWLLLLAPDVVVPAGFLRQVSTRAVWFEADIHAAPGIVGFGLIDPNGQRVRSAGAFPNLARAVGATFIPRFVRKYQTGWRIPLGPVPRVARDCMLVSGRLLDVLGGMDADFFLSQEDVALCRAATRLGWRVEADPFLVVTRLPALRSRETAPELRIFLRHGKLLYFQKHLPRWQFLGLSRLVSLEAHVRALGSRLMGQTASVQAWKRIGAVSRAFRQGTGPRGRGIRAWAESGGTVTRPRGPSRDHSRWDAAGS